MNMRADIQLFLADIQLFLNEIRASKELADRCDSASRDAYLAAIKAIVCHIEGNDGALAIFTAGFRAGLFTAMSSEGDEIIRLVDNAANKLNGRKSNGHAN